MKLNYVVAVLGCSMTVFTTSVFAINPSNLRTINTSASSSINVPVSQAMVKFNIFSQESDSQSAQLAVRSKVAQLIAMIKESHPLNLKTTDISVSPVWSYANSTSKIVGYNANYSTEVTVKASKVGALIDNALALGVSSVDNPVFIADQVEEHQAELNAIKLATKEAKERAQVSLGALGYSIKNVEQVTVQINSNQPAPYPRFTALAASANDSVPATPVEQGSQKVTATVSMITNY